jgi:autotransporter-associated beta strand protein
MKSRLLPSLVLLASACASSAGTIIRANSPGSNGMGATNTAIPATFGDNIALSAPGNAVFETYAGSGGIVGTPDIELTWSATAGSNGNRWESHAWGGATAANTGGGALQTDGTQVNSTFSITFTPGTFSAVKLNSFNFVGDTNNGHTYQYRVDVLNLNTSNVDFTTTTAPWITATAQNPGTNGTFANAPAVTLNFSGAKGVSYRLDIVRITPPSGTTGGPVDMAIDNLDFDQIKFSSAISWSGALDSEWSANTLAQPKNWVQQSNSSITADFAEGDDLLFADTAVTTTIDISKGDVTPGSMVFSNSTKTYSITGANGIIGLGGLSVTGGGTVNLATDNIFTGATLVDSGLLRVGHPMALAGSTVSGVFNVGRIEFGAITNATFGALSGDADLMLASNEVVPQPLALSVGGNNASTTYGGELSGAGSLAKTGNGTLVLNLASPFTGGTTISGGILRMQNAAALGTGAVVHSGGQIRFAFGDGTSATVANDFTLNSTGHQTYLTRGTLDVAPTTPTTVTLTGKISGGTAGQVYRLVDSGTTGNHNNILELRNTANDFEGTIEMWRGTLGISSDSVLGNAENDIRHYTENLNGALRFDADNITLNPNRTIDLPTALNPRPINTQAFNARIEGQITGNAFLVKQGTGTLTLAGATPFTGEARIDAGTLALANDATLGSVSAIAVAAGATLDVSAIAATHALGVTQTLSGLGTVDGAFTALGILSPGAAANTLGTLTFNDGLKLDGATTLLQLDTSTGQSDRLIVVGDVLAGNAPSITLTDVAALPVVLPPATKIAVVEYTGTFTGLLTINSNPAVADGATITLGDNTFIVDYNDTTDGVNSGKFLTLTVPGSPPAGYSAWAAANAGGSDASPSADFDNDGVPNGAEYFMGETGNSFTPNPGVVSNGAVRTVTWPRNPLAAATYKIQVSQSLGATGWTDILPPNADIDESDPTKVVFTLPSGDPKVFVRLAVELNP